MATGIFNVGAGLGALIAPPMVAFLILTYNWKVAFLVTGFIGFIWAILWAVLYRSPEKHPWLSPNELIYIQEGQQELAVETAPSMTEEPGRGLRILQVMLPAFIYRLLRPFLDILLQRKFMALGIARFFSEPAWQFFSYWIPLYLATERGMNLKQIGYFAWLPFLAADLGSLFGGALSPFFMRFKVSVMTARKCSATVSALLMVFAVFVGRVQSVEWAIFFICIASFAHQSMSATLMTLPADLFPESSVATANGLSGTVAVAGGMIFTGIVGVVAQTIGYGPLFTTIAFLDIVGVAFLWALLHQPKAVAKAV